MASSLPFLSSFSFMWFGLMLLRSAVRDYVMLQERISGSRDDFEGEL